MSVCLLHKQWMVNRMFVAPKQISSTTEIENLYFGGFDFFFNLIKAFEKKNGSIDFICDSKQWK